jgi:hypothetical protein
LHGARRRNINAAISDTPNAFPLSWPAGRPRARYRRDSQFRHEGRPIDVDRARRRLRDELGRIDAQGVVLSSNLRLRVDGSVGTDQRAAASDPGVALYFKWKGKDVVLACDSYYTVAGNIAALAAHIEATRAIERYGVGTLEQMFTGLGEPNSLAEAEAYYRNAMRTEHPDVGGSETRAVMLNAAIAMARKTFA